MISNDNRLGKSYKLCSKKIIDQIFEEGLTVKEYPLFTRYLITNLPNSSPFQFVVSAPKKKIKHAVKRNRIKRICKEVIRLNKQPLEEFCTNYDMQIALFIVFTGEDELKKEILEKKYNQLINKLILQIDEKKS